MTGTPKKTSLACNVPDPYVCLREINLTSEIGSKQEVSRHNRRVRLDLISGPKSGIAARQLGADFVAKVGDFSRGAPAAAS